MATEFTQLAKSTDESPFALRDGARVAVIGGGPAGTFFAYFFLGMARRAGLDVELDIYEKKDFARIGPSGCNHCGGIVSESLVQLLAAEGINIPTEVVQRGIDSYVLHTDVGTVRIETPADEKRIAAMYRGSGPRDGNGGWRSFDGYLLELSRLTGAEFIHDRVTGIEIEDDLPVVTTKGGLSRRYELVVGAAGVNTNSLSIFEKVGFGFSVPETTKTYISEYALGREEIRRRFQNSMHVFLLDIPRLKFAALIPKGEHVTLCLLGESIDKELVEAFVTSPEVAKCFPPDLDLSRGTACRCFPKINVRSAIRPFADRIVLVGDSAATRLYKDGIGAAYRTAKSAASCAVFQGVASRDFERHYWPACRRIIRDNGIGKLVFLCTRLIQGQGFAKRGVLNLVESEQGGSEGLPAMSTVLWDTFTGSAPYRDIVRRGLKPSFLWNLAHRTAEAFLFHRSTRNGGA